MVSDLSLASSNSWWWKLPSSFLQRIDCPKWPFFFAGSWERRKCHCQRQECVYWHGIILEIAKKRTCIENVVIGSISKIFLKLLFSWFNQHIGHEKGVVRSGTNNSDSNSLGEVVSCVSIDDVESLSSVEIVSGQVFQNCEGTGSHGDIDFSPTDLLFTNWVSNDSFGRGGTAKVK